MKYIDAEKLYEYIEQVCEFYPRYADNFLDNAVINVINGIKTFIASLQQEQPPLPGIENPGTPGKDFIPVEWVDACEMYGKWKIVKLDQPEVDLEKEVEVPKDIEGDAVSYCFDHGINISPRQAKEFATHYLMLGHNEGYIRGRKDAHILAKQLGLPSSLDKKPEVDLEKEIKNEIDEYWYDTDYGTIQRHGGTITMEVSDVKEIARHFYELGLNARKEE